MLLATDNSSNQVFHDFLKRYHLSLKRMALISLLILIGVVHRDGSLAHRRLEPDSDAEGTNILVVGLGRRPLVFAH